MAEMLLINPRRRRGVRKAARRVARRRNPVSIMAPKRRTNPIKRVRNPLAARRRVMRRRRNPIGMGGGYMAAIREAVMGGAGAVAMDLAYGQIQNFLPASLKRTPGSIGAGDAVKAVATVAIGQLLNKATRGFSRKAAQASLTVQAHEIIRGFVPATMALGYATPAYATQGTPRVGPIRQGVNGRLAGLRGRLNAYTGGSQLLSAYTQTGSPTALLNGARTRENVSPFR